MRLVAFKIGSLLISSLTVFEDS